MVGLLSLFFLQPNTVLGIAAQGNAAEGLVPSRLSPRPATCSSHVVRSAATPPVSTSVLSMARTAALLEALPEPDDPAYNEFFGDHYLQWPLHTLDALGAWSRYPGQYFDAQGRPREAPLIALIDTGVDTGHPDFMNVGATGADITEGGQLVLSLARTFISGDASDGSSDVTDEHGHGTHLAALIAAAANNGVTAGSGIAGLGYPLRLLPLKVAGADGVSFHADISRAVIYAADQGASVIVIAFSGPTWSQTLQDAVDYAWDSGSLLIAPGGDAGPGFPSFPAGCPHVFGVGALTVDDAIAPYSSAGHHIALAAPGGDQIAGVYSALPTHFCTLRQDISSLAYGSLYGTAQAAAHVAAAAGLYAGVTNLRPYTGDEAARIWQALQQSAAPLAGQRPGEWRPDVGRGRLGVTSLVADLPVDGTRLGGLAGRVLEAGRPAPNAAVSVVPLDGGESAAVRSLHLTGAYHVPNLTPGRYQVLASIDGATARWDQVTVLPGCDLPDIDFRLGDPPADAAIARADIPAAAVRGKAMEVTFVLENTGESTWRRSDGYRLKQDDPLSPFFERLPEVSPPPHQATAPGESLHLSFSVPVPDVRGFLPISWRMCQEGGHWFFGDLASATISVTAFLDVPADHWAVDEIEKAKAADIVMGYGDDIYHPEWPVSRGQMAVYLARAVAGGEEAVPTGPLQPTFPDVPADHWAYRYIEFAHSKDIVRGYSEGGYCPDVALDRAQMAVFVARAIAGGETALESYTPPEAPTFPDAPPDSWMYAHVEYVAEHGVVQGYPDRLYHPDDPCTRDQMAVYVSRAFDL